MRDYSDADLSDASVRRQLLTDLHELERRAASLERQPRHDVTNAVGAARNAMLLLDEGKTALSVGRLVEIAKRNARAAADMLAAAEKRSGRDERNDLGRAGERDDADSFGF